MRWPWQHRHKRRNIAAVPQQLQAIQLSSSAVGVAIPLVYGQARVPSKLVHYKKLALSAGNIYGLPTGSDNPEQAAIAMAICEGPITGILQAWDDKDNANAATLTALGFLTFLGTLAQAAWSFLTTNYPSEAVPYELTAYMAHPTWPTPNRSLANYSWEVQALLQWGGGIIDSNPKDIINDFLTDTNHGVGFPSARIASLTTFRDYCTAAGIFLSPVFDTQRPASEILQELLALANSAFVWSDGQVKIVPYGDQNLSGTSATFTANVTPAYNLTDDDFIADEGDDPVVITRRPQSDVYNMVQVEFDNRAYQYNGDVAEAKDQNSIELYTLKPAPVIKAPYVKLVTVARMVAQLALQRQVYLRNTYSFKLPMRYVLLEPMDLVTLTDPNLGLNQTIVRLTEVDENDDGTFSCTAEDWIQGVSSAATYGSSSTGGVPTPTGFEKLPKMPEVTGSFDATGQLILNVSGDSRVVKHIYNVRTDRLPTLAETRAGTTVNFAGQSGIATGISVAAGASVFVGDLAYNSVAGESPQAYAIFKRQGTDVDGSGRVKRSNPFDDGDYAVRGTTPTGDTAHSGVKDSTGSAINKAFHKSLVSDPDHLDSIPDGSTFARILASRLASGVIKRAGALDDGVYALRASETDGSTKVSGAIKAQGSIIPAPMAALPFSYAAGGAGSAAMWIALSWSAFTVLLPDGTTISIPASSTLATPPSPSMSQVALGSLGGRTLFARIGYTKNGMVYRVGAEASLAVSAFNVLKITSPASVAGYDGWAVMVGSATNAEKIQDTLLAFGTDWTEPSTGFDTTGTAYNNTNWPNSVIAVDLNINNTYFFYPWWDLALAMVVFSDKGQLTKTATAANQQNSDGRMGLSPGAMSVVTPAGGGSGSGTGNNGGGKYL